MQLEQLHWTVERGWSAPPRMRDAGLVLAFGSGVARAPELIARLTEFYPGAAQLGCSTAGEILGASVHDDSLVVTAIRLEHTTVRVQAVPITSGADSRDAGRRLAEALCGPGLAHVFILSDGIAVNGTALVEGVLGGLPAGVSVSGGLAGDGERMKQTVVWADSGPTSGVVAAAGFYGQRLRVGYGTKGGWDPFGPERVITRSRDNVLYELDHQSALALYKKYLGSHAADLPASGLLFPLSVRSAPDAAPVVRTILGVDEVSQSITFAGDLPEGHYARLMKANFDRLVDGAYGAAEIARARTLGAAVELNLLVSCVGRRLILSQRIDEELENVREVIGDAPTTGFYSYGELCPGGEIGCELHNQTMTITTLAEV